MTCKRYDDMMMTSYVLGDLPKEEQTRIQKHLAECKDCCESVEEWEKLVIENDEEVPSEKVKQKVLEQTIYKQNERRLKWFGSLKWIVPAMVVMLMMVWNPFFQQGQDESQMDTVASSPPSFIHDPETILYTTSSHTNSQVQGYVWINNQTEEMFIFVNGIPDAMPMADVYTEERAVVPVGSLAVQEDGGHVYRQQALPDSPKYLVVRTVETGEDKPVVLPLEHLK